MSIFEKKKLTTNAAKTYTIETANLDYFLFKISIKID